MSSRLALWAVLLAVAAVCCCCCDGGAAASPNDTAVRNAAPNDTAVRNRPFVRRGWFDGFATMFKKTVVQGAKELDAAKAAKDVTFERRVAQLRAAEEALMNPKPGANIAELQAAAMQAAEGLQFAIEAAATDARIAGARVSAAETRMISNVNKAKNTFQQGTLVPNPKLSHLRVALKREESKAVSELGALKSKYKADHELHVTKLSEARKELQVATNGKSVEELRAAVDNARTAALGPGELAVRISKAQKALRDARKAGKDSDSIDKLRAALEKANADWRASATGGKRPVDRVKLADAEKTLRAATKAEELLKQEKANLDAFLKAENPDLVRINQLQAMLGATGPVTNGIRRAEVVPLVDANGGLLDVL